MKYRKSSVSFGSRAISWHVCAKCRTVDRDIYRMQIGNPCLKCGHPSDSGHQYFNLNVFSIINLMEEFYQKDPKMLANGTKSNSHVAVVLFFVTLREILLDQVIGELMEAHKLKQPVANRLWADNSAHSQCIKKLFPALANRPWDQALQDIQPKMICNLANLNKFIKEMADARNDFMHQGTKWVIKQGMADKCMDAVSDLVECHVHLHNQFVCPLW